MKCFVCGSESPGEVCNQCVRTERNLFHKEWEHKEGFLMKKVESYRLDVTSYRISGTGMISSSDKGLMSRLDAFNHYVGNILSVEKKPFNGKDAVMVHYKNPNTQMERFIFFIDFNAEEGVRNAIEEAKKDLAASTVASTIGMMAGGAPMATAAPTKPATPISNPVSSADMAVKMKKLQVLLDSGILTQEEYENEKRKMGL